MKKETNSQSRQKNEVQTQENPPEIQEISPETQAGSEIQEATPVAGSPETRTGFAAEPVQAEEGGQAAVQTEEGGQAAVQAEAKERGFSMLLHFVKSSAVLIVALVAAAVTCFFVPFDREYLGYFDLRTLSCLFCTLAVVAAFKNIRFFV